MYVIIAILVFGILIAIHEFGHFIAAKACGVRVEEFAVGMGPAIFKKQRGDTLYALRILPIGGYCMMTGEDEESDDPKAFSSQAAWKRFIILFAGAAMNFLLGLLILLLLFSRSAAFVGTTVTELYDGFPCGGEQGIQVGDRLLEIDGHRLFYYDDFREYMARAEGNPVDLTLVRDGEKIVLKDLPLIKQDYELNGETVNRYGVVFNRIEANGLERVKYSLYTSYDFVRLIWRSLGDLVSGVVGVNDLSGPVGIVSTISDIGESASNTLAALTSIAYLSAFIAINLAVMNLLPIPALDGGRIFFLLITAIAQMVFRRRIDPKYEGFIHGIGMVLLLALMAYVMFNDILRIVHG